MKLILNNHKPDALPSKAVIDIVNRTCILDDILTIDIESLFTLDFEHPLLDEHIDDLTQHIHTYIYDDFENLTRAGRFIYSILLRSKNPSDCVFIVKPTAYYQQHKTTYTVPFSMHAQKAAKKALDLEAFNEIASCFRNYTFHYQDHLLLNRTFVFTDLPAQIDGDALYHEDEDMIAFCKKADTLHEYDIRYIHHLIGLGVFTQKNINRGEWIGVYYGLKTKKDPEHLGYTYRGVDDCLQLDIDARHYGNFTCFINHADSPTRYDDLAPELCYANVNASVRRVNGLHFIVFIADRQINAGEQLFVDYGSLYFTQLKHKFFTHRNGRIVDIRGKQICRDSLAQQRLLLTKMATHHIPGAKFALLARPAIAFLCTVILAALFIAWAT